MPQMGIHAFVGVALKKVIPNKENMMVGILLGSLLPDIDILAVGTAILADMDSSNLDRTFTYSIITITCFVLFIFDPGIYM